MRRLLLVLGALAILPLLGPAAEPADRKGDKKPARPVIAVFRFAGTVTESPGDDALSLAGPASVTLRDLVARIDKAAKDLSVKAVVILPQDSSLGLGQTEEVRQALRRVRDAGKEVYAHADSLTMRQYLLACSASRLSVGPTADLWVMGLAGEAPYLRGLLDLIGVKPDYMASGPYKSAAEVFMRTGPSPEAEAMQNWLLDSVYDSVVDIIARDRGLTPELVRKRIDAGPYTTGTRARGADLVDAIEQRQDFEVMLKKKYGKDVVFDKKYGQKKQPKLDLNSPFAVLNVLRELMGEGKKKETGKDTIAIVYVDGPIIVGAGEPSPFGGTTARSSEVRKALDEAARDDAIKAVVLRVDSPGGSAVASEIILDATRRVKAKKPFVVSMGDVAGSGGYYVSCASDTIFADATTITASIGGVSGKLATNGMWEKIGVTFKAYKRGENADLLTSGKPFTDSGRRHMKDYIDEIVGVFEGHVVAIRGKRLKKPIKELAGGRVFTGRQALELGLVDRIGTLHDAIEHVARQAKLKDYEVRVVPEPKNLLERVLEEATGAQDDRPGLDASARRPAIASPSLVELAMPHLRHLDPTRVRLVIRELERLQLLQQEGVILMMPELGLGRQDRRTGW